MPDLQTDEVIIALAQSLDAAPALAPQFARLDELAAEVATRAPLMHSHGAIDGVEGHGVTLAYPAAPRVVQDLVVTVTGWASTASFAAAAAVLICAEVDVQIEIATAEPSAGALIPAGTMVPLWVPAGQRLWARAANANGVLNVTSGPYFQGADAAIGGAPVGGGVWGDITGTLSNQTDLYAQLAGKAAVGHSHDAATTGAAGFLSAADKAKLDGIEAGATADQTGAEIVAAIDTALGSSGWQTGAGTVWGDITGTLSNQTDLYTQLAGKAAATHYHTGALGPEYACYTAADGGSIASGGSGVVPFDTAMRNVTGYSVSSGEVTLVDAATYKVQVELAVWFTTLSNRGHAPVALQTDNSGSWANVTGGETTLQDQGNSGTSNFKRDTGVVTCYVTTTAANKKIRVNLGPTASSASACKTLANMCRMFVSKVQ